uniref:Retrovirus-related Pol polyprotein from transposon TNT 1-94 n=1 Tax=Tanacetum cinerariifolium TaxID=118510 RepID=A0A6L2MC06_TANCI|nr:hypothetical protein [Tanacetum cinerariifolium]
MHNNIMAAGSRDRPPMLATGRYPQWRSRFLRYIDTRPNGEALRKCILSGLYKPTTVLVHTVAVTNDSPAIHEHITVETPMNMSPANKAHFEAEKEAIHLILTGIRDEIYSTVDACQTKEVNELCAKRLARNANPLALVATAQANQDPYYQTSKSHKSYVPSSKPSIPTRTHTTTKYKGKEIAKPITPQSKTAFEEDNDPEQAQRDKDMRKNLALIAKYFKKIYKPTHNNLRTSSNSKNKNVDTTPRYKNDNQSGQFGNQRTMNIVGARENVGSPVVQQSGIQCFNCKEFGHFAKECRKPKRVKDSAYHKEKMLLCKQAEKGVPLQAEQYDWLEDTDEEIDEQELEAHYSYMVKIQENDQNDVESDDEHVAVANLIANLKIDVDESKKIQKQLKKANTTLAQELKECKYILAKTSKTLGESNSVRDSCLVALQNKQTEFEKYKAFNDRTVDYNKLKRKLNETLRQLAQKDIEIQEGLKTKSYEILMVKEKHDELIKQSLLTKSHYEGLVKKKTKVITDLKHKEEHDIDNILSMEKQLMFLNEIVYKRSQSIQTIHMIAPKVPTYNGRPTFTNPGYLKQAQSEIPCLYAFPYDQSTHANRLIPDGEETLAFERESRSKLNKDSQEMHADLKYVESLKKEIDELESDKAEFSNMYDMLLQECVSNEVMCIYFLSLSGLDVLAELQYLYLHKVKECDCLAQKLSKQTESISKEVHTELLQCFAKVEKHSISLEIALQKYLKAQLEDKNIAISELKKIIEKGKPTPFSDSLERRYFSKNKSVPKTNVSEGLSKPVIAQTLPQTARRAVSNTNVLKLRMYRIDNRTTQTRAPQSPQAVRNTNPRVSTSTRVNQKTNVSRPQHRSNQLKDKVVPNNSQVKLKKTQVEEHPRISSISYKIKSVTACNDSLNSRTSNVNAMLTKKPNVVPISIRKPKGHANKSVATPHKKNVATKSTTQKPKSYYRMLYEKTSKAWRWIAQQCPSGYKWIVQLILFIVDSGCTKHMTGNLKLCNFVEKFLGTIHFGNDKFAPILGYGDLGNDLLTGNRGSDLYTTSLQESTSSTPLCLIAKASPTQAWLWHRRLSHLNFDYINMLLKKDVVIGLPNLKFVKDQLCSSYELSKAKRSSFKLKAIPSSKGRLNLLHMDLCGPMRVASINGKKYILVIVDDYSRYTWTLFLRSKDETPEVLKEFLTMIQRNLQAPVITVRTDRGTEFLNKTLNAFFKEEGIKHQTSTARTPEHKGVVER